VAPLVIEFLLLFFVGPALFALARPRISPIPVLWAVTAYCLVTMLRDPKFDRERLWDTSGLWQHAPAILSLFAVMTAIGVALVLHYAPGTFLNLPRSNPLMWGLVMVLYPLLSVYPQGIIYRAFLFDRYRVLFGCSWGSCWPARWRLPLYMSCSEIRSRSRSLCRPGCSSPYVIGKRGRSSPPRSSMRFTGARYSRSGWAAGFTTAQCPRSFVCSSNSN
jgi:hypothetical protein